MRQVPWWLVVGLACGPAVAPASRMEPEPAEPEAAPVEETAVASEPEA